MAGSEDGLKLAAKMLEKVLGAWLDRNKEAAVNHAGSLTFWRDGMVKHLQDVADGQATADTYKRLRKEFKDSSEPVARALQELTKIRNKLGSGKIAEQIDIILNDNRFGKNTVRTNIQDLLRRYKENNTDDQLPELAKWLCGSIATLNAEISKLNRLVHPE